jgi:hypothetical protein
MLYGGRFDKEKLVMGSWFLFPRWEATRKVHAERLVSA